ncbi:MAG: NADH-quinone oxidoreductase subunit K [Planctomycetes bacterium]|nr:NADH-quinone oxidoreductase subunit K [Planctomycetota bacterium]
MSGLGLNHFLVLAALLFATGVLCVTLRRNAIGLLIGVELMLNAANVNLVAFHRWHGNVDGAVFAVFVIMLAAAEAAVALSIVLHVFHHAASISTDDYTEMKG